MELDREGLEALYKNVKSNSIEPVKRPSDQKSKIPDTDDTNKKYWGSISNELVEDYRYGESLAKYGNNKLTTEAFFKRLSEAICAIISNECQKRGKGAEDMTSYYNILNSNMQLLSKEIDKKSLKDFKILAIISSLQGFITNYNLQKDDDE